MFLLVAACGGVTEPDAATTTEPMRNATLATTSMTVSSTTVVTTTGAGAVLDEVGALAAVCIFDDSVPSFSCTATGVPEGAALRWESKVGGWEIGPTYGRVLDEAKEQVAEVIVELRACLEDDCRTVTTSIDTSSLLGQLGDDAQQTTESPSTTARVSEHDDLTAACSLDVSVPSISCTATGVPEGVRVRWESNVAGWSTGPTYEVLLVEEHQFVAEAVVELRACVGSNCEITVSTVDLSELLDEGHYGQTTVTTEQPATTVRGEADDLAAACTFDESVPSFSCVASGAPDGASLRWESNVSGWRTDQIYDVELVTEHQLVAQVVVVLKACLNSTCEQVETTIDTSVLVADVVGGGSVVTTTATTTTFASDTTATTTTFASDTLTTAEEGPSYGDDGTGSEPSGPVPVVIEMLACDDDRITARYETTCRAELSGQVDWVGWGFEKGDVLWDRTENADIPLEDVLVQQVTRDELGEYVLEFEACTGGHKWRPDSVCVQGTTALQVVSSADWADIPCESDPEPAFDRWILDPGFTDEIWATGTATHSGTSQHSYVYPRYDLEPAGVPVYAPVDSFLTFAVSTLTYDNGVKDYGLTFVVSCEVSFRFGHVVNPDQRIVERVAGESDGTWSVTPALWGVTEQIDPVFFEAGDVLFRHLPNRPGTNQGFDYGVFNSTRVNQFLNPDRWSQWNTFFHGGCPFDYLEEPARSEVVALIREGTCHGVNREVAGTLAGMWHFDESARGGGDLVFVEYFDDLIHVSGLNSPDTETEFILRFTPGQATYRLPQEVTASHCYEGSNVVASAEIEGSFDYMFVYAEIVDDLTLNVAFGDGTCPATFPTEYTTYFR